MKDNRRIQPVSVYSGVRPLAKRVHKTTLIFFLWILTSLMHPLEAFTQNTLDSAIDSVSPTQLMDTLASGKRHFGIVDNLPALSTVRITAFQGRGDAMDVSASIYALKKDQLQWMDPSTLLPAFNMAPGVRLEERSPGSLRMSIRGSLLRSPYGVRGIKFYMDGIPLTDAGGNTYLQSISPEQLSAAEIIKGPVGSLYGAGTGGAVLLHSLSGLSDSTQDKLKLSFLTGSFGKINPVASWTHASANSHSYLSGSYYYSKGDRAEDTTHRMVFHYAGQYALSTHLQLNVISFYSDLNYQTPGGLTANQLGTDTTAYPLAIIQKAGIKNRTFFGGTSLVYNVSDQISNTTSLLWSHTNFENPFTSNYEKRLENNYGGRTVFTFKDRQSKWWQLLAGMEWLTGKYHIDNYGNQKGQIDTLQYKDRLSTTQLSMFTQLNLQMDRSGKWRMQAGLSLNQQRLRYRRTSDANATSDLVAKTKYLWSPKLGLTYQVAPSLAMYATASKGFSTPTLSELHPSDGRFDPSLQPESGWNYEIGLRGHLLNGRIAFEASIYDFGLRNAIVRRSDSKDVEYYVNAGKTSQKGAELYVQYHLLNRIQAAHWLSRVDLTGSWSYQPYKFLRYQVAADSYDGHPLTGVAKNMGAIALDMQAGKGFYLHTQLNMASRIPLNDGSTVYQQPYALLQAKLGYQWRVHSTEVECYFGVDNILDQVYSLGNDINAYGGRYFNPAARRNFFTGLQLSL